MTPRDDYIVRLMDLPSNVHGFVVQDGDGFNNVYVNSRMSRELQRETVIHELDHIEKDDFYTDSDIRSVEGCQHCE